MILDPFMLAGLICTLLAITLLVVTILPTLRTVIKPSFWTYADASHSTSEDNIYADQDGGATRESMDDVRDVPQRISIVVTSTALLTLSAFLLWIVIIFSQWAGDWLEAYRLASLRCAGYTLLLVHSLIIARSQSPKKRFYLGLSNAVSTLLLALDPLISAMRQYDAWRALTSPIYLMLIIPSLAQILLALCLHQSPRVYREGRLVDEQSSATAFSRLFI